MCPNRVAGLPLRQRVVSVAAANKHSAAVTSAGEVWTWGGNASGQLGYGTSDSGCNPTPRLVEALKGKQLVKVSAAKHHTGRGVSCVFFGSRQLVAAVVAQVERV